MNPYKAFRLKLDLSRRELGELIERTDKLIAQYESEPPAELALKYAGIAKSKGMSGWVATFEAMASGRDSSKYQQLDLSDLAPDETHFLLSCLEIYRDPDPLSGQQTGLRGHVEDIMKMRENFPHKLKKNK